MNTKLDAVLNTSGRPTRLFIPSGQVSDYAGAVALLNGLPEADWLFADLGSGADRFGETLVGKGSQPYISGRASRKKPIKYDKRHDKRRNRIERMFDGLNDRRRISNG